MGDGFRSADNEFKTVGNFLAPFLQGFLHGEAVEELIGFDCFEGGEVQPLSHRETCTADPNHSANSIEKRFSRGILVINKPYVWNLRKIILEHQRAGSPPRTGNDEPL